MITLSGIAIYPVKSLRGVALERADIARGRFAGDREWMVVDAQGRFMHQRDYPQMARVQPVLLAGGLRLETNALPPLEVEVPGAGAAIHHVPLWRRLAPVRLAGTGADAWLTTALGVPCHLVAFAPDGESRNTPSWETEASLQDATPFHLMSEDSLGDLNLRIGHAVPMNRFRPNLVVRGAAPYAEDGWRRIRIGGAEFTWIKPCTRCKMTMTDQQTGARPSPEPLRTLATYRRAGAEVVLGHYLTAPSADAVTLERGDALEVLST